MGCTLSDKTKGILTIIAAIFGGITGAATSAIPMFGVYFISYYKYIHPSIGLHYSFFYSPISTIGGALISPFGGVVEHSLGPRFNILFAIFVKYFVLIILYQTKSVWVSYICVLLFGVAGGFGNSVLGKHCCLYFPNKKGLLNSVLSAVMIAIMALNNLIGEGIINPYQEQLLEEFNCYPPEVAQNISILIKLILFIIPISGTLCLILMRPYIRNENLTYVDVIKDGPTPDEPILRDSNAEEPNNVLVDEKRKENEEIDQQEKNTLTTKTSFNQRDKSTYKKDLKKALKSKRLWVLAGVSFLSNFLPMLASNTYKTIASLNYFNQSLIVAISTITGLGTLLATPVWGFLADRVKFKNVITFLNIGLFSTGIIMCIFMTHELIFSLTHVVQVILFCGVMLTIVPYLMKIFSIQYSLELGGVVGLSMGLSNVIGSIISFIITEFIHLKDEKLKNVPYIIFFGIGIIFSGISIILVRKAKDDEFNYDEESILNINPPNEGEEDILK